MYVKYMREVGILSNNASGGRAGTVLCRLTK